jgi:carbon dioxide concentrating mechanism protein CcmL
MDVCRVVGQAVSTVKDPGLRAAKLLLVVPCGTDGEPTGELFAAADTVGAGEHEIVLVARGSAARATQRTRDAPTDAAIVGILDSLAVGGETTYRKD